tara:strand:+ start:315 stop:635 length:321 start_codon:yes stop_codon:yes gene_type:complete
MTIQQKYQEDAERIDFLMTRQKEDKAEEQQIKQKYRDKSKGNAKAFGNDWTINVKAKDPKGDPLLNNPQARLIVNLALHQKWIDKKSHSNCFKPATVNAQKVTISK